MPTKKRKKTTKASAAKQLPAANTENQAQESTKQVVVSSGKGWSIFAVLLSMLALAGAGYTWYESQVRQVKSNADVAVGVTEIGGQIARLADNMQRIEKSHANLSDQVLPIEEKQKALISSVDKINQSLQKGVNQYLVDQIRQLMIIANNHLLLSRDTVMATVALKQADVLLDTLSDPRYIPVRQLLAQEISALQQVVVPDTIGLSSQLTAMSKLVPSLPLQNEPSVTPFTDIAIEEPRPDNYTWKTEFRQLFKDILSAVQVQRIDQPPKPLLMPEQRYFFKPEYTVRALISRICSVKS